MIETELKKEMFKAKSQIDNDEEAVNIENRDDIPLDFLLNERINAKLF